MWVRGRSVLPVNRHYPHHAPCFSEASGLKEDGCDVRTAEGESGGLAPFIAIQPFPALLDLPPGTDAVKASCGSRHTAVVTSEWGWAGWVTMEQEVPLPGPTPTPGKSVITLNTAIFRVFDEC